MQRKRLALVTLVSLTAAGLTTQPALAKPGGDGPTQQFVLTITLLNGNQPVQDQHLGDTASDVGLNLAVTATAPAGDFISIGSEF